MNWPFPESYRAKSHALTVAVNETQEGRTDDLCRVGHELTDGEREAKIALAGSMFLHHMKEWEETGDFACHGAAQRCLAQQNELVRGRSAAQVAKMEAERGLR